MSLFHISVELDKSIWYSRRALHNGMLSGCIWVWCVFSSTHLLFIWIKECMYTWKEKTYSFSSCQCSRKPLTEQGWVSSPWLHCWKREPVLVNQHQLHNIIFSRVAGRTCPDLSRTSVHPADHEADQTAELHAGGARMPNTCHLGFSIWTCPWYGCHPQDNCTCQW